MESSQRNKVNMRELLILISKMSLQDCRNHVASEFGLCWNQVTVAVQKARLPMTPSSVASVLHKYAKRFMSGEEVEHIIAQLLLKSIEIKPRTWHVIHLKEQIADEPVNVLIQKLPSRVKQALKNDAFPNKKPQVQTKKIGDLIFMSVQMVTNLNEGSKVYVANPPGEPVALVSTLHSNLLKACAQGLGYKTFEDAYLNGKDIASLLRIASSGANAAMVTDSNQIHISNDDVEE